ncbi:MAG TPA: CHAD domain-containing protein [Solirubrobacteraceae bacterium]|nr:CHAD domain-containing protein [Solirubrobacteraceae bacterium]
MKARQVEGLGAGLELREAARLIVAVRAAELFDLAPPAVERGDPVALHDLRIAAKRLRYVLEIAGSCLPEVAREAERRARGLQDLIGEIHDHDVLLERIDAQGEPERGMRRLRERVASRRAALYGEFRAQWRAIEASELRGRIVAATGYSPDEAAIGA